MTPHAMIEQAACGRCANCHAQEQSTGLSRCSRCKWVAYCSKTCQGAHWRMRHRATCAAFQICSRFRALETNWWRSRPEHELRELVEQHGLAPESMCFYGEVLFLLNGLKPMVLFSNLPAPWRQSFASGVITPSGVLQHTTSDCIPALYTVGSRVETPAEYDMSGDLVLINESRADLFAIAKASLRLVKAQRTTAEAISSGNQSHIVSEDVLAQLLDYPVALSECRESMVEVGYFLLDGAQRHLLTSYCASEAHQERIMEHFQRYQLHLERSGVSEFHLTQTRI